MKTCHEEVPFKECL